MQNEIFVCYLRNTEIMKNKIRTVFLNLVTPIYGCPKINTRFDFAGVRDRLLSSMKEIQFIKMDRQTKQQRVSIIKEYFKNSCGWTVAVRFILNTPLISCGLTTLDFFLTRYS